jgi:hypothetical protein
MEIGRHGACDRVLQPVAGQSRLVVADGVQALKVTLRTTSHAPPLSVGGCVMADKQV